MAEGDPVTRRECALLHATVGESISGLSRQLVEYHAESAKRFDGVEKRLTEVATVQGKIEYQVTLTADQTVIANGRTKALELWRASVEGGGRVLTFQVGLIFGSGVLMAAGLFVAGLAWS
jgi:hypothetical protein